MLPRLFPKGSKEMRKAPADALAEKLADARAKLGRRGRAIVALSLVPAALLALETGFDGNISSTNAYGKAARADDAKIRSIWGKIAGQKKIAVISADFDGAAAQLHKVSDFLDANGIENASAKGLLFHLGRAGSKPRPLARLLDGGKNRRNEIRPFGGRKERRNKSKPLLAALPTFALRTRRWKPTTKMQKICSQGLPNPTGIRTRSQSTSRRARKLRPKILRRGQARKPVGDIRRRRLLRRAYIEFHAQLARKIRADIGGGDTSAIWPPHAAA